MLNKQIEIPIEGLQPPDEAFRTMLRYFGLLRRVMEPFFLQHGISASQWAVLSVLLRADAQGQEGLRLMDLGQRLLIRPPSVTGVVQRLTKQGLVRISSSKDDHRVRLVSLTERGRELVRKVRKAHGERVHQVLDVLDESERTTLNELMSRLCSRMEAMSRETGEKDEA